MLLKTAKRSATVAWSPLNNNRGLLACGTVANAIDDSFETTADLEILSVDFSANSGRTMISKGVTVKSQERFYHLAWGGAPVAASGGTPSLTQGILAGGMVDGSIGLWNPAALTKEVEGEALLSRAQRHKGPVRGLDFNHFKPNLLASGSTESEILIWDLSTPSNPNVYTPGQATHPIMDITCVAWNPKVEHILASTGTSGTSVVWDLRQKRPVISFTDSVTKTSRSALAWNPEIATQVIVASDDDTTPILQMWDLRNAHAPAKTLQGHTRGILGLSWCPNDSSMLLTCGKDNRTLCWNPNQAKIMCELPASTNWNFDVQWSPKLPAILSTSSFDGTVSVYSLTDTSDGTSGGAVQAPGWLKRPAGAAFGFGGQLVTFNKPAQNEQGMVHRPVVKVHRLVTEPEFLAKADELDSAVSQNNLMQFCESKVETSTDPDEAQEWRFMRILFESDARRRLMNHIGFSADSISDEVLALKLEDLKLDEQPKSEGKKDKKDKKKAAESAPPAPQPTPEPPAPAQPPAEESNVDSLFGGGDASDFLGGSDALPMSSFPAETAPEAAPSVPPIVSLAAPLVSEPVPPNKVLDEAIKRAVIAGNFEAAVECCVKFGRMADAMLLAATGGRELFEKTQNRYFDLMKEQPFMNITHCIVNRQLDKLVSESDPKAWKETLAILCTYATSEEFASLCDKLAERLKMVGNDEKSATLCYICAGNVNMTVLIWLQQQERSAGTTVSKLESLMEKICVLLVLDVSKQETVPAIVGEKYSQFAEVLVSQGRLYQGNKYLVRANASETLSAAILRDRIFHSDLRNLSQIPPDQYPAFPFEKHEVWIAPPRPVKQHMPVGQAQQAQYNAVADAFGAAFDAPALATPQQPAFAQQAVAAPQPAFAAPAAQQPAFAPEPQYGVSQQQIVTGYQPLAAPVQQQPAFQAQPQVQQPAFSQPAYQAPAASPAQPVQAAAFAQPAVQTYAAAPAQAYGAAPGQYAAAPAQNYTAPAQHTTPVQQAPPAQPVAQQPAQPAAPKALTPEQQYILTTMSNVQSRICPTMQKKMADDVVKKMQALTQKLEEHQMGADVCTQVAQMAAFMDKGDFTGAMQIQTALTSSVWDEHGTWLQATKRIIDQMRKAAGH